MFGFGDCLAGVRSAFLLAQVLVFPKYLEGCFKAHWKYRREVSGTVKKHSHLPELAKASPAARWETLVLSSHISKPGILWRDRVSAAKVNLCQTDLIV